MTNDFAHFNRTLDDKVTVERALYSAFYKYHSITRKLSIILRVDLLESYF